MASPIDAAWAGLKQESELYSGHTADELRNMSMNELQALRMSLQEQYGSEPFEHLLTDPEDDLREHSYYQGAAPTDWYAPPPKRWVPRPPPRE